VGGWGGGGGGGGGGGWAGETLKIGGGGENLTTDLVWRPEGEGGGTDLGQG